jgi:hypothetical protein
MSVAIAAGELFRPGARLLDAVLLVMILLLLI